MLSDLAGGIRLGGCVASISAIRATDVASTPYQHDAWRQTIVEPERASRCAAGLSELQDGKGTSDTVATASAMIFFSPVA